MKVQYYNMNKSGINTLLLGAIVLTITNLVVDAYVYSTKSLQTSRYSHYDKNKPFQIASGVPSINRAYKSESKRRTRPVTRLSSIEGDDEYEDVDGLGSITGNNNQELYNINEIQQNSIPNNDKSIASENIVQNTTAIEQLAATPIKEITQSRSDEDLSGCSFRKFSLGEDLGISNFVGSLGFEEVTDWNYYETIYDEDSKKEVERKKVDPSPLDPNQPRRTRNKSGSLIRVFTGQFIGPTAAILRSKGLDARVLVKEFQLTGNDSMKKLQRQELQAMAKLQSELIRTHGTQDAKQGWWAAQALDRQMVERRSDDKNLAQLLELISKHKVPFVSVLGELNMTDEDLDPNEWYNALGVSVPKPGSKWIVYEYCGLQSLANYAQPAALKAARKLSRPPTPSRRGGGGGIFGLFNVAPPASSIPPFRERANYVIDGILYQCLEAVAQMHECGLVHGSIGLGSILLSSTSMDKTEAASISATTKSRLRVVFSDFGFGRSIIDQESDENFIYRTRSFGLDLKGTNTLAATGFAMAEDLHALGFVFLGTLLTTLAEFPPEATNMQMPPTGEDQLQRVRI